MYIYLMCIMFIPMWSWCDFSISVVRIPLGAGRVSAKSFRREHEWSEILQDQTRLGRIPPGVTAEFCQWLGLIRIPPGECRIGKEMVRLPVWVKTVVRILLGARGLLPLWISWKCRVGMGLGDWSEFSQSERHWLEFLWEQEGMVRIHLGTAHQRYCTSEMCVN